MNLFNRNGVLITLNNMYEKQTKNGFAQFSFNFEYQPTENTKPIQFWANDAVKPDSGIANYYRKLAQINRPEVKAILKKSPKNPQWIDVMKIFYQIDNTVTVKKQTVTDNINIWK